MSRRRTRTAGALLVALALGAPAATLGQEAAPAGAPAEEKPFETTYLGIRIGYWYQPQLSLEAKVGGTGLFGNALLAQILPSRVDAHDDLGLHANTPRTTVIDNGLNYGTPEAELFFDTEWVSVSIWGVAAFRYEGHRTATRTFDFGGVQFSVTSTVDSRLDQFITGLDLKGHVLNNRIVRLSPVLALRALGVAWTVSTGFDVGGNGGGIKGTTEDIDSPMKIGRWQILPYPEIGLEVKVGYRPLFEVDAKVTTMHLFFARFSGTTLLGEAGVTLYPLAPVDITNIGIRLGGRFYLFDVKSDSENPNKQFDVNMKILGANLSLIFRF